MLKRGFFVLFIGLLSVSGYGWETVPALPEDALPVPIVSQATDYSCGAAALLGALFYWQAYDDTESSLYKALDVSIENGTVPEKIAEVAEANGLTAEIRERQDLADLEEALGRGETGILEIQAWRDESLPKLPWKDTWEDGHYVVLVGMDERNVFFMDPVVHTGYGFIGKAEFMERWHDYDVYDGKPVRHYQLGVFIRGKTPLRKFPAATTKIP